MALVPWPTDTAELAAATARVKQALLADDVPDAVIQGWAGAGAELVQRYAPDAPDAIKDEALIRISGYLKSQPKAPQQSVTVGPMTASYTTSALSAARNSGAYALLSPYKIRRAGVIGT